MFYDRNYKNVLPLLDSYSVRRVFRSYVCGTENYRKKNKTKTKTKTKNKTKKQQHIYTCYSRGYFIIYLKAFRPKNLVYNSLDGTWAKVKHLDIRKNNNIYSLF